MRERGWGLEGIVGVFDGFGAVLRCGEFALGVQELWPGAV